jgi:hypothetical protein
MGDRILSDLNNIHRIRQGFCRIPIGRNPVQIPSEFERNMMTSDRIRRGFHPVPSNSDEIRAGFRSMGIR